MFRTGNFDGLHNTVHPVRGPDYLAVLEDPMQLVLRRRRLGERAFHDALERDPAVHARDSPCRT